MATVTIELERLENLIHKLEQRKIHYIVVEVSGTRWGNGVAGAPLSNVERRWDWQVDAGSGVVTENRTKLKENEVGFAAGAAAVCTTIDSRCAAIEMGLDRLDRLSSDSLCSGLFVFGNNKGLSDKTCDALARTNKRSPDDTAVGVAVGKVDLHMGARGQGMMFGHAAEGNQALHCSVVRNTPSEEKLRSLLEDGDKRNMATSAQDVRGRSGSGDNCSRTSLQDKEEYDAWLSSLPQQGRDEIFDGEKSKEKKMQEVLEEPANVDKPIEENENEKEVIPSEEQEHPYYHIMPRTAQEESKQLQGLTSALYIEMHHAAVSSVLKSSPHLQWPHEHSMLAMVVHTCIVKALSRKGLVVNSISWDPLVEMIIEIASEIWEETLMEFRESLAPV